MKEETLRIADVIERLSNFKEAYGNVPVRMLIDFGMGQMEAPVADVGFSTAKSGHHAILIYEEEAHGTEG